MRQSKNVSRCRLASVAANRAASGRGPKPQSEETVGRAVPAGTLLATEGRVPPGLPDNKEIAEPQLKRGVFMFKHKFFAGFEPAPLSSFFALNERLGRAQSKRKSASPKPTVAAHSRTPTRKVA